MTTSFTSRLSSPLAALAVVVLCLSVSPALLGQTWQRQHPLAASGNVVTSIRVTNVGFDVHVEEADNSLIYSLNGRTGDLIGVRSAPTEVCPGLRVIAREGALVHYARTSVDGTELLFELVEAPQGDCREELTVVGSFRYALPDGKRNLIGPSFFDAAANRIYIGGVTYLGPETDRTPTRQFVIGLDATTGAKTFERRQSETVFLPPAEPLGVVGVAPGRGVYTNFNKRVVSSVALTEFATEGLNFDELYTSTCGLGLGTSSTAAGQLVVEGYSCSPRASNSQYIARVGQAGGGPIIIGYPAGLLGDPAVQLGAYALAPDGQAVQAGVITVADQAYAYLSRSTGGVDARWSYFLPGVRPAFSLIIPTTDGGAVAAGFLEGQLYVVRVDPATIVGAREVQPLAGARVFPNPARDYVTIETDAALQTGEVVDILDITGRRLRQTVLDEGARVEVAGLGTGTYLLTFPRIGGGVRVMVGR